MSDQNRPSHPFTHDFYINCTVAKLSEIREEHGGRAPNGMVNNALSALKEQNIHITRNVINGRLRGPAPPPVPTNVSMPPNNNATSPVLSDITNATTASPSDPPSPSTEESPASLGRPQGSTDKVKRELHALRRKVVDAVTIAFKALRHENEGKRLPKNVLTKLIKEKKREFGLDETVRIPEKTIRNRLGKDRATLTPQHPGTVSPLASIDELILTTVIEMGRIRQPMTSLEIIELANSMIDGTEHQERLVAWKSKHVPRQSEVERKRVGRGYYRGFLKRCGHLLTTKRGRRFACDRAAWSKIEYIEQMYHSIYDSFVEAGVARRLPQPVAYDMKGSILTEEETKLRQYGLKSDIQIELPDHILFADETSVNTNQKDDGHCGGTRYVVENGSVPLKLASTTDHRATVLPFTAATGEPVACIVIFASDREGEHVSASWHSGIDITVNPIVDEKGIVDVMNTENYGNGKYFPGGPTCNFRGKSIPTLTFTNKKGSITADILVRVLKVMDSMELYQRGPNSPTPCAVVDGHDSRLAPSFLKYINDDSHRWGFSLGVPYLTHLWQVGDSRQQNGSFKIQWMKAKEQLLAFKIRRGLPTRLEATDIMPLLNKAWEKSFARVASNKDAVASRGWYPPTYKLLSDPEVLRMQQHYRDDDLEVSTPSVPTAAASSVNLSSGKTSSVMETLLTEAVRQEGHKRRVESMANGEACAAAFRDAKRITAGLLVQCGRYRCDEPLLLDSVNQREAKKNDELLKKKEKFDERITLLRGKVEATLAKKGPSFGSWNADECRNFLQSKKLPTDGAMPNGTAALRARCTLWKERDYAVFPLPVSSEEDNASPEVNNTSSLYESI